MRGDRLPRATRAGTSQATQRASCRNRHPFTLGADMSGFSALALALAILGLAVSTTVQTIPVPSLQPKPIPTELR